MTRHGVIAGLGLIFWGIMAGCWPGGLDCLAAGAGVEAPYCSVLDEKTAAEMLKTRPDELLRTDRPVLVSPDDREKKTYLQDPAHCGYRIKGRYDKTISYIVYPFRDRAEARQVFSAMKKGYAAVCQVEDIAGVGESAFGVPDARFHRFVALRGRILVDVLTPRAIGWQKQIAALLFSQSPQQ